MLVPPVPTHLDVGGVHRHRRLVKLVFVVLISLIGLMVVLDEFVCECCRSRLSFAGGVTETPSSLHVGVIF